MITLIETTTKAFVGGTRVVDVIKTTVSSRPATVCRPKVKENVLIIKMTTASIVPPAMIRPQRSGTLARARLKATIPDDSGIPCKRNNRNFSTFTTPTHGCTFNPNILQIHKYSC
jgi:hypothetical protein